MLEGLFGKDNDMLIWIIIIFLLLSDGFGGRDGIFGGGKGGLGGIFDDNIIIWIIIIFLFLSENKEHEHEHGHR